jgi:stage V sporulation protein D (sporulation-specific penicillin-binding protein)
MDGGNYKLKKMRVIPLGVFVLLGAVGLLLKLYDAQVIKHEFYQGLAMRQQTSDIVISPSRGIIYDRNLKVLASNAPVEQIFISPADIKDDEEARLIASGLSEILGIDYDLIYRKTMNRARQYENIMHSVEISLANEVRQFRIDNNIRAIYFRPQTKRVYPFSSLASHVIGFTGSENEGQYGVELQYNEYLRGVPGRIITSRNALGRSMSTEFATYVDAQNGRNIVLTIDWALQSFLENHLADAFAESRPRERAAGIAMDVHTGEILAMAVYPSFDLNNPRDTSEEALRYINLDEDTLEAVEIREFETEEAKQAEINMQKLYKLWNNKTITEPYEPGSTTKVMTAAMGLEEGVVTPASRFFCSGARIVGPHSIRCHLAGGHGSMNFAESLQVSCNPAIMEVADRITVPVFLKYFDAFGVRDRTGIDLPSEARSIVHRPEIVGPVELATLSFGQRYKITPLQQLVSIAAVANGGKLVTPHVVKSIIDDDGNIIKRFEPQIKRMVISGETSATISKILADGVSGGGSSRNAFVRGYEIAAKTGTSQKDVGTEGRIGSCVAYAPADNPRIAVIILVDEPTGNSVYGGVIAAPYVSRFFADALPYLGIEPTFSGNDSAPEVITVRNYAMQRVAAVKEDIKSRGLDYTVIGSGEFVREQIPRAGSTLLRGGNIILYTDDIYEKETARIPDVLGMTVQQANALIIDSGLNIYIIGAEGMDSAAEAIRQEPAAGSSADVGTVVTVEFRHTGVTE